MQLVLVVRTLGLLLMLFSASLMPPLGISLWTQDSEIDEFAETLATALLLGVLLWWPLRGRTHSLRSRDGFVVVTMFWVVMGLLSALPFIFSVKDMSLADAVFEAISGFTTTGATVMTGLDQIAPSILFFRQEIQWFGGIGVIVSAVAVLPMLGIGGMQLYRAETPGPMKDEKLTPRIAHTARNLWIVYATLTGACALAFWAAGMSVFDAVAHAMTTLSTGGFSTHDASLAYFHSPLIEAIASVFMLMGAISFGVHFMAARQRNPWLYWKTTEVRVFLLIVAGLILVATAVLYATGYRTSLSGAFRLSSFEVVSVITSTGFGIDDFSLWPLFLPVALIFSSFIGGCAGSTAGGMKVIRYVVLVKQGALELLRLVYPNLVRPLKLEGRPVSDRVVDAVGAFFALYIGVFVVLMLALMADGMDQITAFGALATCLNNLGPGLGKVSVNFAGVSDTAKWLLSIAMLLGRLEIFTVLVLFTPAFWRQ